MNFIVMRKPELKKFFDKFYKKDLETVLNYIYDLLDKNDFGQLPMFIQNSKTRHRATKGDFINLFVSLFDNSNIKAKIYAKLNKTELSRYLYETLVWERKQLWTGEVLNKFALELKPINEKSYGWDEKQLNDEMSLINHRIYFSYMGAEDDILYIDENVRSVLKLALPIPKGYDLIPVKDPLETDFTYSNENEIFEFINTILDMLKNNLVEFGKTGEKPLAKTLNILKSSTGINEFFNAKKMDTQAVDMLTRSFSYLYFAKEYKSKELETLKHFTDLQLNDSFRFTISRIFVSHLRKVKFGHYSNEQEELFEIVKDIIGNMPHNEWIGTDNIIKYCKYREYRFDFESSWRTDDYNLDCDFTTMSGDTQTETVYAQAHYDAIFFEPVLKATFFYLAALGLMEIKYNEPVSTYIIRAKDKPYISIWDGLKYVRLTELGKYIFGFSKTYIQKEIAVKKSKIKFDEYKPIITLTSQDTIMLAKLEPFTQKYDENRYILNHGKIFRDCKNYKALELKIESFYKLIEKNPPKVFIDFFEDIKKSANLLKRDLKQVVIQLQHDKRLLELFMTHKKLKELIIKAQGYKIIVSKDDIPKLSKIVKESGFFIDF